jgi:hypothetical protein
MITASGHRRATRAQEWPQAVIIRLAWRGQAHSATGRTTRDQPINW